MRSAEPAKSRKPGEFSSFLPAASFSIVFAAPAPACAGTDAGDLAMKPPPLRQYLYVLRLAPRLHDEKAWTDADQAAFQRHVAHLKMATDRGQLVIAGRTVDSGDRTFGVVVFHATDESMARAFMENDPAVAEKIMTAELAPFQVGFWGR